MGIVFIASLSVGADVVLDAGAGVGVITNLITVIRANVPDKISQVLYYSGRDQLCSRSNPIGHYPLHVISRYKPL